MPGAMTVVPLRTPGAHHKGETYTETIETMQAMHSEWKTL